MVENSISSRQFELIEAAGRILSASGVGGLTIKNLAKEMGFAESAVYRHFDSKEAVITAMLAYLSETMDERLGKVISAENNPTENFEAVFLSHMEFFFQKTALCSRRFFRRINGRKPKNKRRYLAHHAREHETSDACHLAGTATWIFYRCRLGRRPDAHRHGRVALANVQMARCQF